MIPSLRAWIATVAGPVLVVAAFAFNGTTWSTVRGASEVRGSEFDVNTVTAHIPGTNAARAVGSYGCGHRDHRVQPG